MLVEKALEMIVVRRRERPAPFEEVRGAELEITARFIERLPFDTRLVRTVKKLVNDRPERLRQLAFLELRYVSRALFSLPPFALDRRQGGFERLLRRRLVAALALLVEVHRRVVQLDEQRGRLGRRWSAAKIIARQRLERKFVLVGALP